MGGGDGGCVGVFVCGWCRLRCAVVVVRWEIWRNKIEVGFDQHRLLHHHPFITTTSKSKSHSKRAPANTRLNAKRTRLRLPEK